MNRTLDGVPTLWTLCAPRWVGCARSPKKRKEQDEKGAKLFNRYWRKEATAPGKEKARIIGRRNAGCHMMVRSDGFGGGKYRRRPLKNLW